MPEATGGRCVERVKGIEPSYEAWEAAVLPLNYTRSGTHSSHSRGVHRRRPARAGTIAPSMTHADTVPTPDDATDQTAPSHHRAIRSFVLRAGRMGTGQQRALDELGPRFVLPYTGAPWSPEQVFGRSAPVVVEIGFGMGQATADIAAARPDTDFLGLEVHTPGVGALLKLIGERGLGNLRIIQHDAVEVLEHMIPPASLAGVHVFFPDPWHKKKHHKRRLIQPEFVGRLCERLAPGGYLHCATDWEPYAHQMLEVLSAEPRLCNTTDGYAPRPAYRPLTKFEQRGLRLGHGVWDLVFRRG